MAASCSLRRLGRLSLSVLHFHPHGFTMQRIGNLLKICAVNFNTSAVRSAGAEWRKEQGLPLAGNEYGPLTDMADWCYADGRPAPPSKGAVRRKEQQKELAMKIDQLAQEVMDAKENHRRQIQEQEDRELDRQRRELKTKGAMVSKFRRNHRKSRKSLNTDDTS